MSSLATKLKQYPGLNRLQKQHRVTIAEKPILLLHCMFVSGAGFVKTSQGADQHQQRGLGQVKIGDQTVDNFEFITRINENPAVTTERAKFSVCSSCLEASNSSSAHRNYAAAIFFD
jgi:hypothetical protein